MKIRNAVHRGLRRFIQRNDASGLAPSVVEKVPNILTFLQEMEDAHELRRPELEGAPAHRQLQENVESYCHAQLADHVQNRPDRRRNPRPGL